MNKLVISDALLLSEPSSPARRCDIVAHDGIIRSIAPSTSGHVAGPDHEVLDARGRLVTAGWWNCHVHLTERGWAGAARTPVALLQDELDDMFLSRGFCNVVDLASNSRDTLALIRRVEAGELRGPRIRTAGEAIYPPRALPFYTRREVPWYLRWALPTPRTAPGTRRVVRRGVARGASVTKLFTGSYVQPDRVKVMSARTAAAAVEASRAAMVPVFAHPSNAAGLTRAVESGVDALAHVPDETTGTLAALRQFAARGGHLVPTLDMFARTVTSDPAYLEPIYDALRVFLQAGGTVLFGTDVGYLDYRGIDGEVAAMARCGLSPDAVLASMTTGPAEFFGIASGGRVEVGAAADLTMLESESLTLNAFDKVAATVRNGCVVWRPTT